MAKDGEGWQGPLDFPMTEAVGGVVVDQADGLEFQEFRDEFRGQFRGQQFRGQYWSGPQK